jgi:hypothetical protein
MLTPRGIGIVTLFFTCLSFAGMLVSDQVVRRRLHVRWFARIPGDLVMFATFNLFGGVIANFLGVFRGNPAQALMDQIPRYLGFIYLVIALLLYASPVILRIALIALLARIKAAQAARTAGGL